MGKYIKGPWKWKTNKHLVGKDGQTVLIPARSANLQTQATKDITKPLEAHDHTAMLIKAAPALLSACSAGCWALKDVLGSCNIRSGYNNFVRQMEDAIEEAGGL